MEILPPYEIITVPIDCQDRVELYNQCIQTRITVFVDEQKFAIEDEIDEVDPIATHFLLRLIPSRTPVGTLRIYQPTAINTNYYKLGRLVVLKQYRKHGLGVALMKAAHEYVRTKCKNSQTSGDIVLHSQLHAKAFYAKFGYVSEGNEFDEDGAPHQKMKLHLEV